MKKCKGVLAVKTLGSLLYSMLNEHDWLFAKDNKMWKLEQKKGIFCLPYNRVIIKCHLKTMFCLLFNFFKRLSKKILN